MRKTFLDALYASRESVEREIAGLKTNRDFAICKECNKDDGQFSSGRLIELRVTLATLDSLIEEYIKPH